MSESNTNQESSQKKGDQAKEENKNNEWADMVDEGEEETELPPMQDANAKT